MNTSENNTNNNDERGRELNAEGMELLDVYLAYQLKFYNRDRNTALQDSKPDFDKVKAYEDIIELLKQKINDIQDDLSEKYVKSYAEVHNITPEQAKTQFLHDLKSRFGEPDQNDNPESPCAKDIQQFFETKFMALETAKAQKLNQKHAHHAPSVIQNTTTASSAPSPIPQKVGTGGAPRNH